MDKIIKFYICKTGSERHLACQDCISNLKKIDFIPLFDDIWEALILEMHKNQRFNFLTVARRVHIVAQNRADAVRFFQKRFVFDEFDLSGGI